MCGLAVNLQVRIKNNSKTQQEDRKAAIAVKIYKEKKPHNKPHRQILTRQTTTKTKKGPRMWHEEVVYAVSTHEDMYTTEKTQHRHSGE